MPCPRCNGEYLKQVYIVRYSDKSNLHKILGKNVFCPNINCHWELDMDVKKTLKSAYLPTWSNDDGKAKTQ